MGFGKYIIVSSLALTASAIASTKFCDTRIEVRDFTVDSVIEHPFRGTLAANIAAANLVEHSSLRTISSLSKGQDFFFLESFSTSCAWKSQTATFASYSATGAAPKWTSRDSSVWIRYIDDREIDNNPSEWIQFREDTVGWKASPVYSNSYLFAEPQITQWYAYASRIDTATTAQGKQITTRSISSVAADSAYAVEGLLDTWAQEEPITGHKYDYSMQVFKVVYALKENPSILHPTRIASKTPSIIRNGAILKIGATPQAYHLTGRILNLAGQTVQSFSMNAEGIQLQLPSSSERYILDVKGFGPTLVP